MPRATRTIGPVGIHLANMCRTADITPDQLQIKSHVDSERFSGIMAGTTTPNDREIENLLNAWDGMRDRSGAMKSLDSYRATLKRAAGLLS